MARITEISWCDSTVNPVMGCDGCELWTPPDGGPRACYAGTLHERYGGKSKGYAERFLEPQLFPGRMAEAAKWSDLTGTKREDKPWLDGLPRHVFISDMGDALSEGVPWVFLRREIVETVAAWPHVGMWLTKQPRAMWQFAHFLGHGLRLWPPNLWAGASVTDPRRQRARIDHLRVVPAAVRFLSVEPLLADPGALDLNGISLVIVGGESGPRARPCDLAWIRSVVEQCRAASVPVFVKQDSGPRPGMQGRIQDDLWVREFPDARTLPGAAGAGSSRP